MDAELWASFLIGAALFGVAISAAKTYALWPAVAVMLAIAFATASTETPPIEKCLARARPVEAVASREPK